jgi:uncharacterized Ntn-hydrolase superfamily protein
MPHPSTFSIAAFDPEGPAWGIAVASKFPAVGAVVPWVRAGAGAVATQSYANTSFGPDGLELMESGLPAQAALEKLLEADPGRSQRQVGLVDRNGRAATFTGEGCHSWAGGRSGEGYCVQGNILAGEAVILAMVKAFEETNTAFPTRLHAALLAGDRAGGDRRGRQSAAIYIAKESAGYAGFNDRWIDYRVDDHPDPVPRLADLLELHDLYFGESEAAEKLEIEGEVFASLQQILLSLGYLDAGRENPDPSFRAALDAFVGNENFEERTDPAVGWIDKPVYEYLLRKHLHAS